MRADILVHYWSGVLCQNPLKLSLLMQYHVHMDHIQSVRYQVGRVRKCPQSQTGVDANATGIMT
jgi:hypothetical protein